MAQVRREFYDIQAANGSPIAAEAIQRIGSPLRYRAGDPREADRTAASGSPGANSNTIRRTPCLDEQHSAKISPKSDTAGAIRYELSRWRALTRYLDDGQIELESSPAERVLRTVALLRKTFLFAGSDSGGERAACLYSQAQRAGSRTLFTRGVGAHCRSPNQPHL